MSDGWKGKSTFKTNLLLIIWWIAIFFAGFFCSRLLNFWQMILLCFFIFVIATIGDPMLHKFTKSQLLPKNTKEALLINMFEIGLFLLGYYLGGIII